MIGRYRLWWFLFIMGTWICFGSWQSGAAGINGISEKRAAQSAGTAGGVYRLPLLNNPDTLDPAYVHDIYASAVAHQLFDGLVQFSSDLLVIPAIAENWRVEDGGKTYRFSLREDAVFHNGSPITSRDVLFSLSRLLRASPLPTILQHLLKISGAQAYHDGKAETVTGLEAPSPNTFLIRLDQPYVPILAALGMVQAAIVPASEAAHAESFSRRPVGSGPFRFGSWENNRLVSIKRFDGYYGGKALLDGIDFLIYPGVEIERVWADFRDKKLDEMPVYPQIVQNLRSDSTLKWLHRPSLSLLFYGISQTRVELKDPAMRQAMSAVIDREKLNNEVYRGQYNPAALFLPPGMPGYTPPDSKHSSGAKSFSQTEGKPMKVEVVSGSRSPLAQAELAFVGKAWKRLGIELVPKYIPDWPEFERYISSDSVQVYRYAWFADLPDPDAFLRMLFGTQSPVNYSRFSNPEVDALFQKAVGEVDPHERARLYQLAEKRILDACPAIPLLYLSVDHVYQPNVRGVELSVLGAHATSYRSVWLDETVSK